ncbi:mitochondrial 37S ribosomal protein [Martiniozyma asiatica (nom. inval.)]|nr:mitochondrial 37S ribosomal protein [Martiniozyma asiatica]
MTKGSNLNSLVRGRVRPSMNKHVLFNLYKLRKPYFPMMTLFQQKWAAKQETRAYHGEHIREKRWQSLFKKKLDGVAQLDASLKGQSTPTPMVNQTFAPLEKRLEFVLFRAMFASSVRQAKRFILSGFVKVNGVVIKHPEYELSPGDVFSCEPERVLEALGAKKPSLKESYKIDKVQIIKWQQYVQKAKENPKAVWAKKNQKAKRMDALYQHYYVPELARTLEESDEFKARMNNAEKSKLAQMKDKQDTATRYSLLTDVLKAANQAGKENSITSTPYISKFGEELSAKCVSIASLLPKDAIELKDDKLIDDYVAKIIPVFENGQKIAQTNEDTNSKKIRQLASELATGMKEKIRKDYMESSLLDSEVIKSWSENLKFHPILPAWSEIQEKGTYKVSLPWQKSMYGLQNPSKPYFTPWKPRPFLPAFAILPKHLEVSFQTCHGVYLRHPVARPGESEVISPFDEDIHERSYMYYVTDRM